MTKEEIEDLDYSVTGYGDSSGCSYSVCIERPSGESLQIAESETSHRNAVNNAIEALVKVIEMLKKEIG